MFLEITDKLLVPSDQFATFLLGQSDVNAVVDPDPQGGRNLIRSGEQREMWMDGRQGLDQDFQKKGTLRGRDPPLPFGTGQSVRCFNGENVGSKQLVNCL